MFKLTRILHSGANVPEPVKLTTLSGDTIKVGAALIILNGRASFTDADTKPTFIAASSVINSTGGTIYAYPVNSDMVFEVPITGSPASLVRGDKLKMKVETDESVYTVSNATSGVATVFDMNGAKASGDKILVRFI